MKLTKSFFVFLIVGMASLVGTAVWSEDSSLQKARELRQESIRLYSYLHSR